MPQNQGSKQDVEDYVAIIQIKYLCDLTKITDEIQSIT